MTKPGPTEARARARSRRSTKQAPSPERTPADIERGLSLGCRYALAAARDGYVDADAGSGHTNNALRRRGLLDDSDPTWLGTHWGRPLTDLGTNVAALARTSKRPGGGQHPNAEKLEKLDWLAGIQSYDRSSAVRYSPKTELALHQIVVHPSFGVGFVSEVLGDNKVELTFRKVELTFRNNVTRVVVHGRGASDEDLRGDSVDEEELKNLLKLWDRMLAAGELVIDS